MKKILTSYMNDFKKLPPKVGQKLGSGVPFRATKPRLSMKLLWKLHNKFIRQCKAPIVDTSDFLMFVESEMKPPTLPVKE